MVFDEAELSTLRALIDRIIPEDDFPSASATGVIGFLLGVVAFEERTDQYRLGLAGLNREARLAGGGSFSELPIADQDSLLSRVEQGEVSAEWETEPAAFFRLAAEQAIEGYYADPGNGVNPGGIAWEMIGFRVTA